MKENPKVWSNNKNNLKRCHWSFMKLPSEASKGNCFNVFINNNDKKCIRSLSRWFAECRLWTRNSSRHSGEKLGYRKQYGIHRQKEGIWGLLLGRDVDGEGKGWLDSGCQQLAIRPVAWLFSLPGMQPPNTSTAIPHHFKLMLSKACKLQFTVYDSTLVFPAHTTF